MNDVVIKFSFFISSTQTRSLVTAEKQRVSCASLSRLANWSCNACSCTTVTIV